MTMIKGSLSGPVLFLLLILLLCLLLSSSTVSGLGSVVSKTYPHIRKPKTWHDAQTHCRSEYTDLAILYQKSDGDSMSLDKYQAWIGLYKDEDVSAPSHWTWTYGGTLLFFEWATNEPDRDDECAYILYNSRKVRGTSCDEYNFFYCYSNTNWWAQFIPLSKTWSEAQQHCRKEHGELIALNNPITKSYVKSQDFPVWIGLHREGATWKWSLGSSDYRNWIGTPSYDDDECVSISSVSKKMATKKCSEQLPFVCVSDNLLLVKEKKTWEEALEHCRAHTSPDDSHSHYDLLSVQPGHDQNYIMTSVMKADTEEVWVGLRFLAGHWLWVTGADMLFTDLPKCPLEGKHCGALSQKNMVTVETRDCTERKNFLCYRK